MTLIENFKEEETGEIGVLTNLLLKFADLARWQSCSSHYLRWCQGKQH